jgi:hypothetical protein
MSRPWRLSRLMTEEADGEEAAAEESGFGSNVSDE